MSDDTTLRWRRARRGLWIAGVCATAALAVQEEPPPPAPPPDEPRPAVSVVVPQETSVHERVEDFGVVPSAEPPRVAPPPRRLPRPRALPPPVVEPSPPPRPTASTPPQPPEEMREPPPPPPPRHALLDVPPDTLLEEPDLLRGPRASQRAAVLSKRVGQALRSDLTDRDRSLGVAFPWAQRIGSIVATAARHHVPQFDRARFVARLDRHGRVRGLKHVSFRGGRPEEWRAAHGAARRALEGRSFDASGARRGAHLGIAVTSGRQRPAGTPRRRGVLGRRGEGLRWPWAPAEGPRPSPQQEVAFSPQPPELQGVCPSLEARLPPCDPADTLCPRFRFDVSNAGAPLVRVVRSHVDVTPVEG